MTFVDSNVFLRYITQDDVRAQSAAAEVFARIARRDDEGWTTAVHVHETVYVLASRRLYNVPHADIRDRLRPLLVLRGLKLQNNACAWKPSISLPPMRALTTLVH